MVSFQVTAFEDVVRDLGPPVVRRLEEPGAVADVEDLVHRIGVIDKIIENRDVSEVPGCWVCPYW